MEPIAEKSSHVELGSGENMITSVKYGSTKVGGLFGKKTDHYIHITDKRVVVIDSAGDHLSRDEIFVDDIAHVHGGIKKIRNASLAVLAFLFAVITIVLAMQMQTMGQTPWIVCAFITAIFLLLYCVIGAKAFVLSIDCKGVLTNAVSIGISTVVGKRRKGTKSIKVKADVAAADKILSSIGKVVASKR